MRHQEKGGLFGRIYIENVVINYLLASYGHGPKHALLYTCFVQFGNIYSGLCGAYFP